MLTSDAVIEHVNTNAIVWFVTRLTMLQGRHPAIVTRGALVEGHLVAW